jgi:hypothetical protein
MECEPGGRRGEVPQSQGPRELCSFWVPRRSDPYIHDCVDDDDDREDHRDSTGLAFSPLSLPLPSSLLSPPLRVAN